MNIIAADTFGNDTSVDPAQTVQFAINSCTAGLADLTKANFHFSM